MRTKSIVALVALGLPLVACVGAPLRADAGPEADGGGLVDGGAADARARDAAVVDAGLVDADRADSGDTDAGSDGAVEGVTCIVQEREPGCVAGAPVTYEDVPFAFHPDESLTPLMSLTSPLEAFWRLNNSPFPPAYEPRDAAGVSYTVGPDAPPNVTRTGVVLDVDIDVQRQGSACVDVPEPPPLIHIRCTGHTVLPSPACEGARPPPAPDAPALTCVVSKRDAACTPLATTMEVPRFWLAPGAHGPESEIHTDSAALIEAFGGADEVAFFQEAPCASYVSEVRAPSQRIVRDGVRLGVSVSQRGTERCRDGLGRLQPVLEVSCEGATTRRHPLSSPASERTTDLSSRPFASPSVACRVE
ncbi:MAG: hypothetical protein M3Y87_07440 [Myxococcota bacterium]|nr:hypothetical protein [Myxococcota bacterium]